MDEFDNVTKPRHYAVGGLECIEVMRAVFGDEKVMAFCQLNAFKYVWRSDRKNGLEDVKKAEWYMGKYVELKEKAGTT